MQQVPWRLEIHDVLDSTSELCRSRAEAGEPAGLAVMACRQERGRGSHGRAWSSPPGNLYLSVLLRPDGPLSDGGQWSLLAAVVLAETAETWLPERAELRLKWPNDLLLGGRKLAGILLDSAALASDRFASLVIGWGLNLAARPDLPDREAACLADVVKPPLPEAAAHTLLDRCAAWHDRVARDGFAPVRDAWLARSVPLGASLLVRQGAHDIAGAFAGLGADGSLLLDRNGTRHAFAAGEVRLHPGTA
jgi:BirA family biotin operon repressor/biotin-[acetyl-CoA-carboxylase] ligase